MKGIKLLALLLIVLTAGFGCVLTGTNGKGGDGGGEDTQNWTAESGIRIPKTTSTSTIVWTDGTANLRTYAAGPLPDSPGSLTILTATSTDGLIWSALSDVGLRGTGDERLRNPTVLQQPDGTYLMIYEGVTGTPPAEQMQFYRATSRDGITYTKTEGALTNGAVMLPEGDESHFLGVPELVRVDSTTLRIYFVTNFRYCESATSTDEGMTWAREGPIELIGLTSGQPVLDPELYRFATGEYRLYFATPADGVLDGINKRIRSALSSDGRTFTMEDGDRIAVIDATQDLVDPDVVETSSGQLRMYYGQWDGISTPAFDYDLVSALSDN